MVLALEGLPRLTPRAGFADRVMARVAVPGAVAAPASHRVPAFARAAVVALLFVGGLASSISWSLAQYGTLMAWRDRGLQWALGWFEGGTARLAAELQRLDWLVAAQTAVGSPTRWALLGTAVLLVYAAGLLALRRLTALPSSGAATHAA